jgi:acyl carrier protein
MNRRALWTGLFAVFSMPTGAVGQESSVRERVIKKVVEHVGVQRGEITDSKRFIEDLGVDSLDATELIMAFELEFKCSIPDESAAAMETVGDAVKFLTTCKGQAPRRKLPPDEVNKLLGNARARGLCFRYPGH